MGLDMYLYGEKFYWTNWKDPSKDLLEDGFKLQSKILYLGYWRKHPDLHGFIVKTFANGRDECQRIHLTGEDLIKIIEAVKSNTLPHTEGFFFGTSENADEQNTIEQLEKALEWIQSVHEEGISRQVYYEASW